MKSFSWYTSITEQVLLKGRGEWLWPQICQSVPLKIKIVGHSLLGDVTKDIKIQEVYLEQIPSVTLEKKQ